MPRPLKANAYPIVFWRIAEGFADGSIRGAIEIRGEDIYNPGRGETPEACASKMRFKWYGFKKALDKINHNLSRTVETLELSIMGSVLTIQRRDDTEVNRALERVLEAQGIRISAPPSMFRPPETLVEGAPPMQPRNYGGAREIPVGTTERTPEEKARLEEQWLKEGVAQTKHFEETLRQLGFVEAPQMKPEDSKE